MGWFGLGPWCQFTENVAYLVRRVNKALAKASTRSQSARRGLEAELRKAEREADNIKDAVRHGKATATLLEMLEEAAEKVQRIRADLETDPKTGAAAVQVLPELVERYARGLRATLCQDVGRARVMLSRFLGDVVLRPEKDGLWAEVRGNFGVLLDGNVTSVGAGRGI